MKLAYLCPMVLGGLVVISTNWADDLSLSSPENAKADASDQLTAASSGVNQPVTSYVDPPPGVKINLLDELKPGEDCDEKITGQFWYKLCYKKTSIRKEIRTRKIWKVCWVFDPVKCCNVARKVQIDEPYEVEIPETSDHEELRCVTMEIPFEKLKGPSCDCEIPVRFTPTPTPTPIPAPAPDDGTAIERPAETMLAKPERESKHETRHATLEWLPKADAAEGASQLVSTANHGLELFKATESKKKSDDDAGDMDLGDTHQDKITAAPTRLRFNSVFVQRPE